MERQKAKARIKGVIRVGRKTISNGTALKRVKARDRTYPRAKAKGDLERGIRGMAKDSKRGITKDKAKGIKVTVMTVERKDISEGNGHANGLTLIQWTRKMGIRKRWT